MDYIWNITGRCNLNCQYCWDIFKHEKELKTDKVKELMDVILAEPCNMVLFTGGEPLMREDLFEVVDYCNRKGVKNIKVCSNGLLISKRISEIKASPISEIHISLDDGKANFYDFRSGNREVLGNLDILLENVDTNQVKIVLVTVIDHNNLDKFENVLKLAKDRGIYASYQLPVIVNTKANLNINIDGLNKGELVELFENLKELHHKYKQQLDYFSNYYYLTAKDYYVKKITPEQCPAGQEFKIISPGGDMYTCYCCKNKAASISDCFNPRCLIWYRTRKRAHSILNLLNYKDYSI